MQSVALSRHTHTREMAAKTLASNISPLQRSSVPLSRPQRATLNTYQLHSSCTTFRSTHAHPFVPHRRQTVSLQAKLSESDVSVSIPAEKLTLPVLIERGKKAAQFARSRCFQPLRGWIHEELIEVRPSEHGLGVFARVDIPPGLILGEYPGWRTTPNSNKAKEAALVKSTGYENQYLFQNPDGWFLDPTDDNGDLPEDRSLRWGPFRADTTLALINEPDMSNLSSKDQDRGPFNGTNVVCEIQEVPGCILCITFQPIVAGEELLMWYGEDYDRSHY